MSVATAPLLEARGITKSFGAVNALRNVSLHLHGGEVLCLLGDNGAGKSTLIRILSGVFPADAGEILMNGVRVKFRSARDALNLGIATVYQDLALVAKMPVYRNFVLGREPLRGIAFLKRLDKQQAKRSTQDELRHIGIDLVDLDLPVMNLSGGERQAVAIARAVHFGARVLILDEPTSALGVRESEIVLGYVRHVTERGVGVVFITHNPHHARQIGDRFTILRRGALWADLRRNELGRHELSELMTGDEFDPTQLVGDAVAGFGKQSPEPTSS